MSGNAMLIALVSSYVLRAWFGGQEAHLVVSPPDVQPDQLTMIFNGGAGGGLQPSTGILCGSR